MKKVIILVMVLTLLAMNSSAFAFVKEEGIMSKGIVDSPADPKFEKNVENAVKALEYLNGVVVKPGEIFSFNKAVGKRTIKRGFVIGLYGWGITIILMWEVAYVKLLQECIEWHLMRDLKS
ncbi:VanW family protein [Thermoanaerobacter sp. CM-CNRG TB177]|uniref:VanW family protein n=1 Tax=Thermoanaerobacter sp. CM-CNRG TB177 TaxID=2800659 RepID=UPI001BDED238|nr:VanW family protein [Thermoanaerobacter sp. CM-CNRG TB177]